jgi:hypothetical protein
MGQLNVVPISEQTRIGAWSTAAHAPQSSVGAATTLPLTIGGRRSTPVCSFLQRSGFSRPNIDTTALPNRCIPCIVFTSTSTGGAWKRDSLIAHVRLGLPQRWDHQLRLGHPVPQDPDQLPGGITLTGGDAHGWDFKVQKAQEHATSLGFTPVPLEPAVLADTRNTTASGVTS